MLMQLRSHACFNYNRYHTNVSANPVTTLINITNQLNHKKQYSSLTNYTLLNNQIYKHKVTTATSNTTSQIYWERVLYQGLDLAIRTKNFQLFETSVSKMFLQTRIDKHRSLFLVIRRVVNSLSLSGTGVLGFKLVLKGKLSRGGNSRKGKMEYSIPIKYLSNPLWKSLKYSVQSKRFFMLVPTKTGISSCQVYITYTR